MFTGTDDLSTPDVLVPPRGRGFLAILTGLWMRTQGLLLDNLGTSLFGRGPLAALAALVTSASQVPVMTYFPGLLSGFLAYLYTWYCFPALFSLESRMQTIPLEAFYSGLGLHVDTVLALQVF